MKAPNDPIPACVAPQGPRIVNTGFVLDTITGLDLTHLTVDRHLLSEG